MRKEKRLVRLATCFTNAPRGPLCVFEALFFGLRFVEFAVFVEALVGAAAAVGGREDFFSAGFDLVEGEGKGGHVELGFGAVGQGKAAPNSL